MARVTLDKGNWIVVSLDGARTFGEITDYTDDSDNPDIKWVQVQLKFDMNEEAPMDLQYSFSNLELSRADELTVFDEERGRDYYRRLLMHMHERSQEMAETEEVEAATPDDEVDVERTLRRLRQAVDGMVERPNTQVYEPNLDIPLDPTSFDLTLTSGDMQTVINIAEKNISLVFGVIDKGINELGHVVFKYLPKHIREKTIHAKIDHLMEFNTIKFQTHHVYLLIVNEDEKAKAMYIGKDLWYIPRDGSTIEGIHNHTIAKIKQEYIDGFEIKPLIEDVDGIIEEGLESIKAYDSELINLEASQTGRQKRTEGLEKITGEMLGDHWVDAITFAYFEKDQIPWDKMDVTTFKTKDAISMLAASRNELSVLGLAA